MPKQIAIIKCQTHTNQKDPVSRGNAFAQAEAKKAAAANMKLSEQEADNFDLDSLKIAQNQASSAGKQKWKKHNCSQDDTELWQDNDTGLHVLPRSWFHMVARVSHGVTHVSKGGMVDIPVVQRIFTTFGFF